MFQSLAPPAFVPFVSRAEREVSVGPSTSGMPLGFWAENAKFRSFLIKILRLGQSDHDCLTICGSEGMTLSGSAAKEQKRLATKRHKRHKTNREG
jgi:hypothetical protein